jgi:hypothetical protein
MDNGIHNLSSEWRLMMAYYPQKSKKVFRLMFTGLVYLLALANSYATETVIYSEGFENNNGGFTHIGTFDTWEWGIPSTSFTSGPVSAHSGSKCWGTDLDNTVPFNSNAYLTSPAITLPAIGSDSVLRVRFFGWIAIDLMADRGEFQVSSDGVNWETKAELLCVMQGGWNEYAFDISGFAGSAIYLRFRCVTDNANTFDPPDVPVNNAGFYIDDIAITLVKGPVSKKNLTFEGSESQNTIASCPWIYIPRKNKNKKGPDGGILQNEFQEENDIYSTARGNSNEYTDYYQINKNLSLNPDSTCILKLKETGQEESFTDLLHLIVIDHSPSTEIASDELGSVFTYKKNKTVQPTTAVDKNNASVIQLIKASEEYGCKAFNGDYIDLTFSWSGSVPHPILLLKAQGFLSDGEPGTYIPVSPKIEVQTQDASGKWTTRHIFYPRWKMAQCGYDLAGLLPLAKKVRLLSSSCMTGKYNLIDWAAISTENQSSVTITDLAPQSALRSDGIDVTTALSNADNNYVHLIANEEITLTFKLATLTNSNKQDFIVKSKGYYNPTGTYFFYTWNGSAWTQRDGWTIPLDGDQTRQFDFSLWLPDPTGQNRVRIWQDFIFDDAAIDFVGLRSDSISLIMNYATDLRNNNSILNLLNSSDNQRHLWDYGEDWPNRIRWVEIGWANNFVNTPPSTNPVFVTNTNLSNPVINWNYIDLDGNPQKSYEIEVWTGPGGTGNNVWDPQMMQGTASSITYAGTSLTLGQKYYARVKAFDSLSWGGWSEVQFIVSSNNPPIANAGNDTVITAVPTCLTSVPLNGSASYDPENDPLSFLWIGSFGTVTGKNVAVSLYPGINKIFLVVSDGKGSAKDSVIIRVRDTIPPVPDVSQLSPINGECRVTITTPPTATDNCSGLIVGVTDSLVFSTKGTRVITWRFTDSGENVSFQTQTVSVTDNSAPVPDLAQLPVLQNNCALSINTYPTATDNCKGQVVATTTDPLVYQKAGTYTIHWWYNDGNGNSSTQNQTAKVIDNVAPVPSVNPLPAINGVLSGNTCYKVRTYPTAMDNCKGRIVGTSSQLTFCYRGTFTIVWQYSDGNGNSTTQNQTINIR